MARQYILLVEDNADDEELTMRAIRRNRIDNEIVVARDGAEAVDRLLGPAARPDNPVVILLDVQLPKLSGLEVLKRLRASRRTATVPVVILTSSKEERDRLEGYQSGVNSYIQKPVDFREFVEVVAQIGRYWLNLNEPPPTVHA